jgi:sterol desaturase/sphingolipid hydroxylase (fatty acid hydroxylase superfamily)
MLIALAFGFIFWSPIEYFLHRYLGHEWTFKSKFRKEHQKHHFLKDYFASHTDKTIAVFPIMILIVLVGMFFVALKYSLLFGIGFLLSYLTYEWFHKSLHVKSPRTRLGKCLRKHHFHHHFENPNMNFGVTTRFWDRVFGTFEKTSTINVPKKYKMNWLETTHNDYIIK